jgi:hypothetical protein
MKSEVMSTGVRRYIFFDAGAFFANQKIMILSVFLMMT